ncbi:anti-sigma-I factor RsgI family protein [Metabacillus halosaccharovorans]|uniref:anti-sigma-I factor RsgI family protein n=1 Tax=Metabacillus halosaccharovorans TaxID=930124 RepID=UPI001C1F674F|nr:anti-sigma factor domain-containing protein [Metabacillus halosaccharovorans]MBU7591810.1 anti-sigma factor domain-containing protein [Metabacillus halosaccharovorans]
MKKGVVVDLDDDFVTLLTPDGQFLKASNKEGNYELGEEISFFPLVDKREEAATRTKRASDHTFLKSIRTRTARVGALSAVAIIFFMISFLPLFNNDKVYAYMSIDINPSFEVSLDDHLKVISLVPLNDEANNIMKSLNDWEKKPLNEIVQIIISECKSDGYVYPGKEIVITTVMNDTDKKIEKELHEGLTEISSVIEAEEMVVKTINSDKDTRDKAQEQGVSTGKYIELVEQKEESKETEAPEEADDSTQSEITPAPIVPEKKGTSITSQVKGQQNTKPADNTTSVQKDKSEAKAKEKLTKAKEKLQENAHQIQQKRNENKQHNNQHAKFNQEERKKERTESKRQWQEKKDRYDDNDDRDDDRKVDRKENNRGKNNNGRQDRDDNKRGKKDRDDD